MKIVSWNVNGIRAIERKGNFTEILSQGYDVICFQETKAEDSQLSAALLNPAGYSAKFYSSTERKGHAGVSVYTKLEPSNIVVGGIRKGHEFDTAGRIITTYIPYQNTELVIVNCYFPNGADRAHHDVGGGLEYKLGFYNTVTSELNVLRETHPYIIVCGDYNVAHTEIDLARPKENKNSIGFLPAERQWLTDLLADGWIDTYRHFNPDKIEMYTWWDTISRARDRNVGWRIDYIVVSQELLSHVKHADILTNQMGSDHCPVAIEIK